MKQYVVQEYSSILGPGHGFDDSKIKGNKYYDNHLKALEMQRQEEKDEKANLKIKIMAQAELMQYDDDFDEEDMYNNSKRTQKYKVDVVTTTKQNIGGDNISEINKKTETEP